MNEILQFGNVNDAYEKDRQGFTSWLLGDGATVVYFNEFGPSSPVVRQLGEVFVAPCTPADPAVLVRGRAGKRTKARHERLTPFIHRPGADKPKLWRDRWLTKTSRPGRRRDYVTHLNAAAQDDGRWLANPGAEANIRAMRELYDMLRVDMKAGWSVRVAMDGNINDKHPDEPWTPAWVFNKLGLEYINTDVCYIAWDDRRDECVDKRRGEKVPGSDGHGTLYVELKRRPWYRRWLRRFRKARR